MITLYTTDCPQCRMLEAAMRNKGIQYDVIRGAEPILEMGFESTPILVVDDEPMQFADAVRWVNDADYVTHP